MQKCYINERGVKEIGKMFMSSSYTILKTNKNLMERRKWQSKIKIHDEKRGLMMRKED